MKKEKLIEKFAIISNKIDEDENTRRQKSLSFLAKTLFGHSESKEEQHSRDDLYEKNIISLSWYCYRIIISIELCNEDCNDNESTLYEDIKKAINILKEIEGFFSSEEKIHSELLTILSVISPQNEESLLYLCKRFNQLPVEKLFSTEISEIILAISDVYEQNGEESIAYILLENVCDYNSNFLKEQNHRIINLQTISKLAQQSPETAIRIAKKQEGYFRDIIDEYSGDYYWFWACANQIIQDNQNAKELFYKCFQIRLKLYGENNWYTALAYREYAFMIWGTVDRKKGSKMLMDFVMRIRQNEFVGVDENFLKVVEGKTLYLILMSWNFDLDRDQYIIFLNRYEQICDEYDQIGDPLLQIRLAKNLRGSYYLSEGDYIQSENAFNEAIEIKSKFSPKDDVLPASKIKTNLLLLYYAQNDTEMAYPLLCELFELLQKDKDSSGLSDEDRYRIYSIWISLIEQSMEEIDVEELNNIKELLFESCDLILNNQNQDSKEAIAIFVLLALPFVLQNSQFETQELAILYNVVEKIISEKDIYTFNELQTVILYFMSASLEKRMHGNKTKEKFEFLIDFVTEANIPIQTKAVIYRDTAEMYNCCNEKEKSRHYSTMALCLIEERWHSCVQYLNDNRLISILEPIQMISTGCYSILRTYSENEYIYEQLMKFKALASLAGRERNLIIHKGCNDSPLVKEIHALQEKIALMETGNVFRDTQNIYLKEKKELRKLEAEFARNFPKNNSFTKITWEAVQNVIPEDSVVIEYYLCVNNERQINDNIDGNLETQGYDVFITKKKNGNCTLNRLFIKNGELIIDMADTFVEQLQHNASGISDSLFDDFREQLFSALVKPILPYIEGMEKIYIAPDTSLINLPIEILYNEDQECLEDNYSVIKIECIRDFLFKANDSDHIYSDSLIIGNPQYEVSERNLDSKRIDDIEFTRSIDRSNHQPIKQLPFSELESKHVAKYLKKPYYINNEASKQLLLSSKEMKNIHIATHGFFQFSEIDSKGLFSAGLLFAGVDNWRKWGSVSKKYGNGIVTADEISRLDLHGTELVVLSSCLSGMNDTTLNKSFHGMIGALFSAGVKYVISHLWEADDFSTAIVMDAFYHYYVDENLHPSAALHKAKTYVRNVTIKELIEKKWFEEINGMELDPIYMGRIRSYEKLDLRMKPFKNESFWAGFACYQSF